MAAAPNLDDLALDALADALIGLAQRARTRSSEGGALALAADLDAVRAAADRAMGPRLAVLEVAEAFLRALAHADLGGAEVALHRFALDPRGAVALDHLAAGCSVDRASLDALGGAGRDLLENGGLRALPGETFDLRPTLRGTARRLTQPAVLQAWRHVQQARDAVRGGRDEEAAERLAAQLGVTKGQALAHLARAPLGPA